MAAKPKISHPKKDDDTFSKSSVIVQGKCTDARKDFKLELKAANGNDAAPVEQLLLRSRKNKHWGKILKGLPDGKYILKVKEKNEQEETRRFEVKSRPLKPAKGKRIKGTPDVWFPSDSEQVYRMFFIYGYADTPEIFSVLLFDSADSANGVIAQHPDGDGFWWGWVECPENFEGRTFTLHVTDANGTTPKNNISIVAP